MAENNKRNKKGGNAAEKSNERKPEFIQATGLGKEPPAITAGPVMSNRMIKESVTLTEKAKDQSGQPTASFPRDLSKISTPVFL